MPIFDVLSETEILSSQLNKGTISKLSKISEDILKYIGIIQDTTLDFTILINTLFEEHTYILTTDQKAKETKDETLLDKLENITEFRNELIEYSIKNENPNLTGFLEDITLQMQAKNSGEKCVNFLTLHSSKGLEFKSVFIYGLEDGIIPLVREFDDGDIEEERRLLYVGITRAKDNLTLIRRQDYPFPGKRTIESRFLDEIDKNFYENLFSDNLNKRDSYFYDDDASYNYKRNDNYKSYSPFTSSSSYKKPSERGEDNTAVAKVGDRVIHRIFGMGKILQLTGAPSDPIAMIDFINVGVKKLKYNVAGLKKV